jgi:hypothetical protein
VSEFTKEVDLNVPSQRVSKYHCMTAVDGLLIDVPEKIENPKIILPVVSFY